MWSTYYVVARGLCYHAQGERAMNTIQFSLQFEDAPRTRMIALAWAAILIVSVPRIIYHFFVPVVPGEPLTPLWLALAQVGILTLLLATTWAAPAVKPLRGFLLALLAYSVGLFLILPLIGVNEAWSDWKQQASWGVNLVAVRLEIHLVLVVLMSLTLIGSGIGRRELFLVRGNPSATAKPSRLLLMKEPEPWNSVVRKFLPVFIIIAVVVMGVQVLPFSRQFSQILIFLPAIVAAAAINAIAEEYEFRSVHLARLEPVLGPGQAILMTSALFGLVHYFGVPSGPAGVVLAMFLGWLAAKSMIETRGIVWAFLIHFVGDFIIYSFWAMLA
jgi:hypothetical protein